MTKSGGGVIYNAATAAMNRRVVVTGLGLVTPLGCGVDHVWKNLISGKCGVRKTEGDGYSGLPCRVAAFVPKGEGPGQLDAERHVERSESRTVTDAAVYALAAAQEAVGQAKLDFGSDRARRRTGVAVGTGMTDLERIVDVGHTLRTKGYKHVGPFFIVKILSNTPAGQIGIRFGLTGPNHCVSTACAAGLHAVGDAARFLQYGDADAMLCGGTEACVGPLAMAAFCRARALATRFNDDPSRASRPFDERRDGFVMGEGAAVLVLETLEHARRREAEILAEVTGYGLSSDGHHSTAPREDGLGILGCMEAALRHGNADRESVGYVNAHATSTPVGDAVEGRAIEALFAGNAAAPRVSSTKGATGHLLGAAGAAEAIFTVLACKTGVLPPTINLDVPLSGAKLNHVANQAQKWESNGLKHRTALTNSFGFGGTNASLCIRNWIDED